LYILYLSDTLRHIKYHMTIDLKTIKHISKLSRISVNDEKAKKLADDLNSIFKFIEKLKQLDTENVEPLTSVAETTLKLRLDEVKSKDIRDQILKNSPEENEDFFVVPRVVE
jgi:aspartyl-tRNA(Asn)/glutamyl-tRNA(Gln) amidotransferase subunit C